MKNYFIIIPVYNDNKSLNKLLFKLNKYLCSLNGKINILVINDYSTESILIKKNLNKLNSIKIINLKKNVGSQKAIYIALKYLEKFKKKSNISIMDSDGEDNPKKLKKLIIKSIRKTNAIVVANRFKRKESLVLRSLNRIRLIITFVITGQYINFGNFSSFSSDNLIKILRNKNLWFAYSGGVKKNTKKIIYINIEKEKRYYDKSKVNLKFLLLHSLKIISIFKNQIFFRSIVLIIFLFLTIKEKFFFNSFVLLIITLNIFIFGFYQFHNLNFNPLNLIKSIKKINNNR